MLAKDQRDVRVANEADLVLEEREVVFGLWAREQILPDRLARAAVSNQEALVHLAHWRQRVENLTVGGVKLLPVPDIGDTSVGVEIGQVNFAEAGQVVV